MQSKKINWTGLLNSGLNKEDIQKYIPKYLTDPTRAKTSVWFYVLFPPLECFLRLFVKIFLRPRTSVVGKLDQSEVDNVYSQEAGSYDQKHHITTRGQDLEWRRWAAWHAINLISSRNIGSKILDLCTGTGLTIVELEKISRLLGISVDIVGLDYCADMLKQARANRDIAISRFVRGDAKRIVDNKDPEFADFQANSQSIITQVFGIGGIDQPLKNILEVLKALREDGRYILIDMHAPIAELSGELPLFFKWMRFPNCEKKVYYNITIPLALNRLWAWRDTTWLFYFARLICTVEQGRYYGFEVENFFYKSERWWFALPFMPVARATFKKIQISRQEYEIRQKIINNLF